jgi:outer membrane protein assembly factor BamB
MTNSMKALCVALVLTITATWAQEWTRFRGPNGTGISPQKGIPATLSNDHLQWKTELPGVGHSSPVLWGQKIFLTTSSERGDLSALCLEATDGRLVWKKDFPLKAHRLHKFNSFASSTPAVDSERVYILLNEPDRYVLAALNHDGSVAWKRDFGPFLSQHGCGVSPIVYDGMVIVANEHGDSNSIRANADAKSFIVAVDAKDGTVRWQTARQTLSVAYSTPCVYEKDGQKALVFNSEAHGIYALDPHDGKVLWEYDQAFDKRSVSSPVIAGDVILGSCGSGGGGNFVTAVNLATGKPSLAYNIRKSAPYVPTPVTRDGLAWLLSDGGILTCIDSQTGEIKFQERLGGNFFGSPVWIDGHLYAVATNGDLVITAAKDNFQAPHRFPLGELCHTTPAVALGKLFVRTEKHLWCFGGAKTFAVTSPGATSTLQE